MSYSMVRQSDSHRLEIKKKIGDKEKQYLKEFPVKGRQQLSDQFEIIQHDYAKAKECINDEINLLEISIDTVCQV